MKILLLLLGVVLVCGSRLPLPDSRLPPPDSRLPLPDGRLPLPDSRLPLPDGRLPLPDGRLPLPDGRLPLPDGRLPLPDGRLPLPEGRLPLPDSHPPLQDNLTQLSGEWNTLLVAATNFDKISNGPFHGYMRKVDVDIPNGRMVFKFSVMMNGLCTEKSAVGTIGRDKIINIGYAGQNNFKILHYTLHSIIVHNVNVDSEGTTTEILGLLGKRLHPDDNDFAKFRELMRENNIPEENLIDMSKTEKCPKKEKGTNPS
ncbi:odorant-binding protein-like isoform X2 [Felis catus]|uniref:odorant-binding protein-like isoform X2 n=1 Tax=Felis catus TaxID=9685 RepID=UPI001D19A251|nr:odorant-binding protein-like isoform X2 [Felis catus]